MDLLGTVGSILLLKISHIDFGKKNPFNQRVYMPVHAK